MIDTTKIDQMVKKMTELFHRFIYFEDNLFYTFSAIYVLFTYFYDIFDQIPYLQIYGLKDSGKSRLGDVFKGLCFNPFNSSEISNAALYRKISKEHKGITMIIDEKDDIGDSTRNDSLLSILRSGYRSDGNVTRCGRNGTIEQFSTFCPKIIINEKGIQDSALESRTIPIHMIKSIYPIEKFRFLRLEMEFKEIKDLIHPFTQEHRERVFARYHFFKSIKGIKDRNEEVWAPIFIIAGILDTPDTPFIKDDMVDLAKKIIGKRKRMQLIGNIDAQILESTRAYIEEATALGSGGFYIGEELCKFIKDCWSIPDLRLETVSRALKRHDVVTGIERHRLKAKGLSIQKTCYTFDKKKLENLVKGFC